MVEQPATAAEENERQLGEEEEEEEEDELSSEEQEAEFSQMPTKCATANDLNLFKQLTDDINNIE